MENINIRIEGIKPILKHFMSVGDAVQTAAEKGKDVTGRYRHGDLILNCEVSYNAYDDEEYFAYVWYELVS